MNIKFSVQPNAVAVIDAENIALLSESTDLVSEHSDFLDQIEQIAQSVTAQYIELIIIPDRYVSDEEVLQTIEVRKLSHARKKSFSMTLSASFAKLLLTSNDSLQPLMQKVYKISTIRHGFSTEIHDENQDVMIKLAQRCTAEPISSLKEIVIRACYSAGSIDEGLTDPITMVPIGHSGLSQTYDEYQTKQSRAFLEGDIGESHTADYHRLKQLTIRSQTISIKGAVLKNPDSPNVLYSMRQALDNIPELRHLSVKAYYERVNPVPEANPTRMGLWYSRDRPPNFFCPKAVRLISPDCEETGEKPNHLRRSITS